MRTVVQAKAILGVPAAVAAALAALLLDVPGDFRSFLYGLLFILIPGALVWVYWLWAMRRRQPELLPEDVEVRSRAQLIRAGVLQCGLWTAFSLLMTIILGTQFAGFALSVLFVLPLGQAAISIGENRRSEQFNVPSDGQGGWKDLWVRSD